jgi:hypothetical protein
MGRPKKEKVSAKDESFVMPTGDQLVDLLEILRKMSGCHQFIKDKREDLKDFALDIEGGYGIPKKVAAKMGKTYFAGDFEDQDHENAIYSEAYSRIIQAAQGGGEGTADPAVETVTEGE